MDVREWVGVLCVKIQGMGEHNALLTCKCAMVKAWAGCEGRDKWYASLPEDFAESLDSVQHGIMRSSAAYACVLHASNTPRMQFQDALIGCWAGLNCSGCWKAAMGAACEWICLVSITIACKSCAEQDDY